MKLVIIESPYAGDIERNIKYARLCMHDCLVNHNEAPYASHLLYTQEDVLRDHIPEERRLGIEAGLQFKRVADLTAVYIDFGWTKGMRLGVAFAEKIGKPWEERVLPLDLLQWVK